MKIISIESLAVIVYWQNLGNINEAKATEICEFNYVCN